MAAARGSPAEVDALMRTGGALSELAGLGAHGGSPELTLAIHRAISLATGSAFLTGLVASALALVVVLALREVPLRSWTSDAGDPRGAATLGEGR